MSMNLRRLLALTAGIVIFLGMFGGCGRGAASYVEKEKLKNDGRQAVIVLGEVESSPERTAVLEEISQKYSADFPNTTVKIKTFTDREELERALHAGELDIVEVTSGVQAGYVREGLLTDLYDYVEMWEEKNSLTAAAKAAMRSVKSGTAYMIPYDFAQMMLYYRSDWFGEYNREHPEPEENALVTTWDQICGSVEEGVAIPGASEQLGDRGGLAFAGRDGLDEFFDLILWSAVSSGSMADGSTAYFAASEKHTTIFTLEKAEEGLEQFVRLMERSALPGCEDWTREQAIEAFCDGRAGMLLADRFASDTIADRLPEGAWVMTEMPQGTSSTVVDSGVFSGWGISSACKDPAFVMHFLAFLSNADNNTHYAKVCGTLPVHVDAPDMDETLLDTRRFREIKMRKSTDVFAYAFRPALYQACDGYGELANDRLQEFLRGELSRTELLSWMDQYWTDALNQEGVLWEEPEE